MVAKNPKRPKKPKKSSRNARKKQPAARAKASPARNARTAAKTPKPPRAKPILLSGGNPQIPKGYGDAPVRAYIAAMPGWKSALGRRLDAIIERVVPKVRKAVKWNSPFYGVADESRGWFLAVHVYARYVQVTFLNGAHLRPPPPKPSKHKNVRYLDIREDDFAERQFATWVKQASRLPGEKM